MYVIESLNLWSIFHDSGSLNLALFESQNQEDEITFSYSAN